jgi:hypothetical protein
MFMAEQMEPVPTSSPMQNGNELSTDGVAGLLALARQRINEGNPSLSLQAVCPVVTQMFSNFVHSKARVFLFLGEFTIRSRSEQQLFYQGY